MKTHLLLAVLSSAVFCFASSGCAAAPDETPQVRVAQADKTKPVAKQSTKPIRKTVASTRGFNLDQKRDVVSICYSLWHDIAVKPGMPIYDNTEILRESKASGQPPKWGPLHAFHFWAKPALGYYRMDDAKIIRRHMEQIAAAGIDFIIADNTNSSSGSKGKPGYDEIFVRPAQVMLDTMLTMKREGKRVPAVAFWNGSPATDKDAAWTSRDVYQRFYQDHRYDDLFVFYEGKPLVFVTDTQPEELNALFTVRKMWGLQSKLAEKEWSFLQPSPQNIGMNGAQPEQISVSAALQRSYMTQPDAIGRRGGRTFAEQWKRAFEIRPRVVTLTWWNEWMAQRFEDEAGNTRFVDNYDEDFSRDIEPMSGGHGDQYYRWMKSYIAAYKAHRAFPENLIADAKTATP